MSKIMFTGKQFVVTIPKDLIEIMEWDQNTQVIISKYPNKEFIFIEKIKRGKS